MCALRAVLKVLSRETNGFSLIEMAIVLAIMGIVAGLSIPALTHFQQLEREKTTKKHQEMILHALGTFGAREGFIPSAAPNSSDGISKQGQRIGYVPYRKLGLPSAVTLDGWGHPIRYAVDSSVIFVGAEGDRPICKADQNFNLRLIDDQGNDKRGNGILAVVLVSEGPAFGNPRSPQEKANCTGETFYALSYKDIQNAPFRHLVTFATTNNLMAYYGGYPCQKAPPQITFSNATPDRRGLLHPENPSFQGHQSRSITPPTSSRNTPTVTFARDGFWNKN